MNILLVDDDPTMRSIISQFLIKMQHQPITVSNGKEALGLLKETRPDLILLDVVMPEMNGFETAEHIRSLNLSAWIPLIFLTGELDDESNSRGIEVGGDDYLTKPISYARLKAKLDAFFRMVNMQRLLEQKNNELAFYYNAAEEEQRLAKDLMNRMVRTDMLNDPSLIHWLQPAKNIGGDLIAAARTPNCVLHVLLADATGHGLAASINVLPIAEPFYEMTTQGYGISAIISELNSRVKRWSPTERFVAATLVAYDYASKLIEVWCGGNPAPFFINADGEVIKHFSRRNWPLGIVSSSDFDAETEILQLNSEGQLIFFSDGAVEVSDINGLQLGRHGLLAEMQNCASQDRMNSIKNKVVDYLMGEAPQDDISVAIIECNEFILSPQINKNVAQSPTSKSVVTAGWRFELVLTEKELKAVDVVPLTLGLIQEFDGNESRGALFTIISELFNNALDHGVLCLDSKIKLQSNGMEDFLKIRQSRLMALDHATIRIALEILDECGCHKLKITVCDSGKGFDFSSFLNTKLENNNSPYGRGIQLVKKFCERLEYFGCGNEVKALYVLGHI